MELTLEHLLEFLVLLFQLHDQLLTFVDVLLSGVLDLLDLVCIAKSADTLLTVHTCG